MSGYMACRVTDVFIALTSPTSTHQMRVETNQLASLLLGCSLMLSLIAAAQTVNALMTSAAGSAPISLPCRNANSSITLGSKPRGSGGTLDCAHRSTGSTTFCSFWCG